ncbi:hypothetical protein KGM_211099 [Danaus plexippus plexippus]|uniref:Uncharacterized protein n=1 Tax=Danaus plexippus plexippus TaxID=278856 RepID=A0A212EK69_DANPL|nr:hypothetical protein KGM_211099 [Danaus plexippus plexippus]
MAHPSGITKSVRAAPAPHLEHCISLCGAVAAEWHRSVPRPCPDAILHNTLRTSAPYPHYYDAKIAVRIFGSDPGLAKSFLTNGPRHIRCFYMVFVT